MLIYPVQGLSMTYSVANSTVSILRFVEISCSFSERGFMSNLVRLRNTVQEYLRRHDLTQSKLARASGMSSSDLSRLLNGSGKRDINCRDVRSIVKGLAEIDAISTRR